MKYTQTRSKSGLQVAPFAGAWIEIHSDTVKKWLAEVAPFAGAWIEIMVFVHIDDKKESLPSRERGLKSEETRKRGRRFSRSLRGSVD